MTRKKSDKQMSQRQSRDDDPDQSGLQKAVRRTEDKLGGVAGKMSAAATTDPDSFIEQAAIGDHYECKAARIALERARSDEVRMIAHKMLDDHMTSSHQLRSTLRSMKSPPGPPRDLDKRRQTMIDHLNEATDEDFDQRYLEQQLMAHEEAVALFESFATRGEEDPALMLFAAATLPSLHRHRAMVERAQDDMKA